MGLKCKSIYIDGEYWENGLILQVQCIFIPQASSWPSLFHFHFTKMTMSELKASFTSMSMNLAWFFGSHVVVLIAVNAQGVIQTPLVRHLGGDAFDSGILQALTGVAGIIGSLLFGNFHSCKK